MKSFSLLAAALLLVAGTAQGQQRATVPAPTPPAPSSLPAKPESLPPPQAAAPSNELDCHVITGRVTDALNNPLTGATVMLRSRTKGYSTDAFITNSEGQYVAASKQPILRGTVLEISAGGYTTFSFPLENCKPIDAALEPLPGTRFKSDGRIKKTSATGKIH